MYNFKLVGLETKLV